MMSRGAERVDTVVLGAVEGEIAGVQVKELRSFPDERGFFREVVRRTDPFFQGGYSEGPFGQWSHSKMGCDVVKAWHFHHRQTDWWYLGIGLIKTVLIDNRVESPTYGTKQVIMMGDREEGGREVTVMIPPGVLHGCRVLTPFAHLFYITSETYDPLDEGRIPFNDPSIAHSWGDSATVAPNDTRHHMPPYDRIIR